MKFPLVVCNRGDINLYETEEDMLLDLEPIDVLNNEYIVYDAAGNLLRLDVIKTRNKLLGGLLGSIHEQRVILDDKFREQGHEEELRKELTSYLTRAGRLTNASIENDLSYLLSLAK